MHTEQVCVFIWLHQSKQVLARLAPSQLHQQQKASTGSLEKQEEQRVARALQGATGVPIPLSRLGSPGSFSRSASSVTTHAASAARQPSTAGLLHGLPAVHFE